MSSLYYHYNLLIINYNLLFQAIERWEKVTELVLKREDLLAKLEKFERAASDPNRFFEKGTYSSVLAMFVDMILASKYWESISEDNAIV